MKKRYQGKISFTIDNGHPDIKCIKDWEENKIYTFTDIYTFEEHWERENIESYIKNDLKLVAGGGYRSKYISNVTFEIKQV